MQHVVDVSFHVGFYLYIFVNIKIAFKKKLPLVKRELN